MTKSKENCEARPRRKNGNARSGTKLCVSLLIFSMLRRSLHQQSPRHTLPGIMDVDEVFQRIGGFGKSQKTIYFLVNSVYILLGIHSLAPIFIGVEPKWTCGDSEEDQDTASKCLRFGQGMCVPKYSKDFTSIVSEVSNYYCIHSYGLHNHMRICTSINVLIIVRHYGMVEVLGQGSMYRIVPTIVVNSIKVTCRCL